jgi:ABC-type multidrug transport system fused ATPase/permease subunit
MIEEVNSVYSAPFEIVIGVVFLYSLLGWSAFVGVVVLAITSPVNAFISKRLTVYFGKTSIARDKRMAVVSEALSAIKLIKFFAWEQKWMDRVMAARDQEMHYKVISTHLAVVFVCSKFTNHISECSKRHLFYGVAPCPSIDHRSSISCVCSPGRTAVHSSGVHCGGPVREPWVITVSPYCIFLRD